ncbi:hypothetical protein JCM33374_g1386 [Metschnikowia sp. JCM 33374]|nr:hypothetical protein JCM33374_g1386 [Metschnikowia sp. JCM 33374]
MTSPYQTSPRTKVSNNYPWMACYYNDPQVDLSFSVENSHSTNLVEGYPLRYCSNFPDNYAQTSFSDINVQGQLFQGNSMPQAAPLFGHQNPSHLAFQDLYREPFFSSSFNDTDSYSSCGSPSFDVPLRTSSVSTLNDIKLEPSSPVVAQKEESPLAIPSTQQPVKKHKRKHIMNRSKLGCWICRIKHLKCDEIKPTCNNCDRFGIQCDYSQERPAYVSDMNLRRKKLDTIVTKKRRRANTTSPIARQFNADPTKPASVDPSSSLTQDWLAYLSDT